MCLDKRCNIRTRELLLARPYWKSSERRTKGVLHIVKSSPAVKWGTDTFNLFPLCLSLLHCSLSSTSLLSSLMFPLVSACCSGEPSLGLPYKAVMDVPETAWLWLKLQCEAVKSSLMY